MESESGVPRLKVQGAAEGGDVILNCRQIPVLNARVHRLIAVIANVDEQMGLAGPMIDSQADAAVRSTRMLYGTVHRFLHQAIRGDAHRVMQSRKQSRIAKKVDRIADAGVFSRLARVNSGFNKRRWVWKAVRF